MGRWRDMSKTCRVEYIEMPKVACTSIKAALLESDGIIKPTEYGVHMNKHFREVTESGMLPDCVFTFVREPVDRCLSAYYGKLRSGNAHRLRHGKELKATVDASFSEWVDWVVKFPPLETDKHWAPQWTRWKWYEGVVDFIGRFERLQEDWEFMRDTFGLPALRRFNGSDKIPPAVVREEDVQKLVKFYARDYREFAYDPDDAFRFVTKEQEMSDLRITTDRQGTPQPCA